MKMLYALFAALLTTTLCYAQEDNETTPSNNKKVSVAVTPEGIEIDRPNRKRDRKFRVQYLMVDFGINALDDRTDYSSEAARAFVQVPEGVRNENLFTMRTDRSFNVNLWPVIGKYQLYRSDNQKIYLSFGAGFQFYNFKFNKSIRYINDPNPAIVMDSIEFSKNKLGMTIGSIPIMLTCKTRLADKAWLVYGAGITGGFRIASWIKQVSEDRGTDKYHDKFNLNDFNSCITGEVGISGYFRLYATYQITPLHQYALNQHPFCIGLRFGGV